MGFGSWSADNELCPGAEMWKIMGGKKQYNHKGNRNNEFRYLGICRLRQQLKLNF